MTATSAASIGKRVAGMSRELKLFVIASLVLGIGYSMNDSIFNNFLNERFQLTPFQRSFLEFPRELPGFLVIFVSALLWFLCSRRLGGFSILLAIAGVLLVGFFSPSYAWLVVWLFIYSMGQHLFMPVASTIGMELANEGQTGKRLGQLNAVRNLAAILGSLLVLVGFRYFKFSFQTVFSLVAVVFVVAAILLFSMKRQETHRPGKFLTLHKEYKLYYILCSLAGSRKQLFITFAPWVLVTIFKQPTQIIATLMTVGGVIGILFQPFLGRMIDRLGERLVLATEAILLIFVCFGYGFSRSLLPENIAFLVVCGCFLFDQMLFSVSMARSTFMKKIAMQDSDIQPALTVAVTIDHFFSITAALVGGLIWNNFGFQYVFLMGSVIAVINFFAALQVRIPKKETRPPVSGATPQGPVAQEIA
jgi:predicted MFS family arabinose efflux permease